MRVLLDSQVMVWWMGKPDRISRETLQIITDPRNPVYISAASVWELGIKVANGNLTLPEKYLESLMNDGFATLDVTMTHAQVSADLPMIHSDPFDRMIIAQARSDDLVLISADRHIRRYNIKVIET